MHDPMPPTSGPGTDRHVVVGAGPVGRAVVASLRTRGVEPVVVTRSGTVVPGARSRTADVADPAGLGAALADAAVVYQCSQPPYHRWPQEFPAHQAAIVDATAAAGAILVAAENLYGYGPVAAPLTEDLPLVASTRKGAVRAAMWRDLEAAHRAGKVRVVAGRASDFFGPGVGASAVGDRFFGPLAKGRAVQVVGDPDRRHTYTYVPDFGEALVRLGETPAAWGRAWHVPNAPTVTTREFAARAATAAALDREPRLRAVPRWQVRALGTIIRPLGEIVEMLYEFEEDFVVDHSAYAALLGDHATPLDEALVATMPTDLAVAAR